MIKLYHRLVDIYKDYRASIPSYASAALAFYLLLIIIPALTLIAIGASLLNLDLSIVENILNEVIQAEYAKMFIDILYSKSMNTVAFVTMLISLYTVSRGVRNIYEVSKNLFHNYKDESLISYYLHSFKMTIFLLLMVIGMIAISAIVPLTYFFDILSSLLGIRHIFLYVLLVFCLTSIYMSVPRIRIHYYDALQGGLLASALLLILYYGLGIYFQFADFQSVYGPLATIIIILFVFNLVAEVFYIGMYVTHILDVRREENEKSTSRN